MEVLDRIRGCLLGGAIGDALGAPIEFQSLREIRKHHGTGGVTGYVTTWRGRTGLVTDDTQMTLFTVEGLLDARVTAAHASGAGGEKGGGAREHLVAAVRRAYLRWLDTQQHTSPPPPGLPHQTGGLREESWLYSRRAPGNACLSGLQRPFPGPSPWGLPGPVNPDSKGCGTVMRSAPFGLVNRLPREAFELAAACAQITHGHPTGYLAAGAFAAIITHLMAGRALEPAVHQAMELLAEYPGHEETTGALRAAVHLAGSGGYSPEAVESLGGAWVAEEALAIGVYCALVEPAVDKALLLSVNHSGDSDSTGSVCGNLLGALHGTAPLPAAWLAPLEGRDTIERLAAGLI
ncbi:ADP-ribosylglycohydrolase family protein [Nonomuraea gerenzanensis]|uniref:Putative ADP-ribosylglycohydrolase n=1 Tax=Nonomuraea gerenzanensis TaxID=93944 RepID=A0A1M4EK91_9ACTN|nr:ADP-ribosylglycohydrolase family protein [Nonomuraea gerenzanensis]UBU10872.1 ADP-ribosylglycohydrolase family protein [Nonomuraea gerenzanensis]SBO99307.1 putative ADP-ribosylglycohydrolase [Nonomuraea gerenzanensis]